MPDNIAAIPRGYMAMNRNYIEYTRSGADRDEISEYTLEYKLTFTVPDFPRRTYANDRAVNPVS